MSATDFFLPEPPSWLVAVVSPPRVEYSEEFTDPPTEADRAFITDDFESALHAVRTAKSGTRNDTLVRTAFLVGKMVGAGALDEAEAVRRLVEAAMSAGLSEREGRRTVESGLRAGMKHPWRPRASDPELTKLNQDHFHTLDGKSGFVIHEGRDAITGRLTLQYMYTGAFKEKFGNRWIKVSGADGSPKWMKLGDAWMIWSGRRQYDRIVFAPGRVLARTDYNLWQGFSAEPMPGECGKFLALIQDVICNGDIALTAYLTSWMARAVQQPGKPGEVAVVLKGRKGTGKTFFADHFGDIFGEHYTQMSSSHHLVGHFNAHLEAAIVVFADEAFWAGDKPGEGTLKTLITGATIRTERKGIDSKEVRNYIHLIMASNSDWVVPASVDERRFFVLEVSDARRQDHAYFAEIEAEWQAGGREAFMHYLLTQDLSDFNVRHVPTTAALFDQKLLSLPIIDRWYLDMLRIGRNAIAIPGQGMASGRDVNWWSWVSTMDLWINFTSFDEAKLARGISRESLGMSLSRLIAPAADGRPSRRQVSKNQERSWGYAFPPLEECRAYFAACIGKEIEWVQADSEPEPGPKTQPKQKAKPKAELKPAPTPDKVVEEEPTEGAHQEASAAAPAPPPKARPRARKY